MNRRQRPRVAGVEKLQQIEGLPAEQDVVRPVTEGRFQQVADGHSRKSVLWRSRFESHQVRMGKVNLRGILDQKNALLFRYELAENIERRCFPGAGAAADQNVLARENAVFEPVGERLVKRSAGDQVIDFEVARVEFANRQRDAVQARRRNDGGHPASIRQP